MARLPPPPRLHRSERVASYRERARQRKREREGPIERAEREREREGALPGTLEVNVLRMVGRCLVCSRLISTWVSSLEPPPSTPSTVLHLHTHAHTIHRNRQSSSTTERIQRQPTSRGLCALAPLKVHVRFICLTFSPPPPFADPLFAPFALPANPTAIRFFHSPSYSLARPTFHATAR